MQEMQHLEIEVLGLSEDGLPRVYLINKNITLYG